MAKGKNNLVKDTGAGPELIGDSFASIAVPTRLTNGITSLSSLCYKFPNLNSYSLPYDYGSSNFIVISDAVLLCQKAYARVGTYTSVIDTMVTLANTDGVYLDEGNNESISFFQAWLKRINIEKLKNQFFRELFRSGNIFLYRVDGKMTQDGAKKLKQLYARAAKIDIPLRYILLNPANIAIFGALNFENPLYYRVLTKFELDVLKASPDSDQQEIYKNLPDAIKSYFDGGTSIPKPVQLDTSKLHTVFYRKQDYEPFATPMGFAVLDSLELKLALQKCDAVLARTVEYVILLVTMGEKKSEGGTNPESLRMLKEVFKKDEIGRVLVSDYTTKADFIIPDLNKIFGEEKYKAVNQDIAEGLMNIFFQTESRASNISGKLKVFSERINGAQEIFVNEFLNPEIKRISKLMGFKSYPIASLGKIDLDDTSQLLRVYTQLIQMGVLTPKDGLEAIERGVLPEYDDLHTNQEGLKTDKDKGLFQPLQGGPYSQLQIAKVSQKGAMDLQQSSQDGQIEQTKVQQQHEMKMHKMTLQHQADNPQPQAPQLHLNLPGAKTVKPGAGPPNVAKPKSPTGRPAGAKGSLSMAKLIDNIKLHSELYNATEARYKKENKVKKLADTDKEQISIVAKNITEVAKPEDWLKTLDEFFVKGPSSPSQERVLEIEGIREEFDLTSESAAIVYHSLIEE